MNGEIYVVVAVFCWSTAAAVLFLTMFPRVVWLLREAAIASDLNRRCLFPESIKDEEFRILQLRALMYDGVAFREGDAARLSKLREVFLAMDHRGREENYQEEDIHRYGRRCLRELARIVGRQIAEVKPSLRVDSVLVYANEILRFIANRERESRLEPPIIETTEVEDHFRTFPITVEQVAELLQAAGCGLLLRREPPVPQNREDKELLSEILQMELRLRAYIALRFAEAGISASTVLRATIGDRDMEGAIRRGLERGEDVDKIDNWIMSYTYLDQSKQLVQRKWEIFRLSFPSKREFNEAIDSITPIRNDLAHSRPTSHIKRKRALAACAEIQSWIGEVRRE